MNYTSSSSSSTAVILALTYSNCFYDHYNIVLATAFINILLYAFICLPDYPEIIKIIIGFDFSILIVAIFQSIFGDAFPNPNSNPVGLTGIYIGFFIIYYSIMSAFGEIAFVFIAMIPSGPVFYTARSSLSGWLTNLLGIQVSDLAAILLLTFIVLVLGVILIVISHSKRLQRFIKSMLYAFLATISVHLIFIYYGDPLYSNQYCCGNTIGLNPTTTCPVQFDILYLLLLIALIFIRWLLDIWWIKVKKDFNCCLVFCGCCREKYNQLRDSIRNKSKNKNSDEDNNRNIRKLKIEKKRLINHNDSSDNE